jgi:hypothetical protein
MQQKKRFNQVLLVDLLLWVVDAVEEVVDHNEIEYPQAEVSLSATAGSPDVERLVDYFRRMFSYSPEYFRILETRIRSHAFC